MDRLKKRGADLVYRCGKGHAEPLPSSKYSGELVLTPLELITRIAQLVPPPRTYQHRYYGVRAPNSPLRAAVTGMVPVVHGSVADAACPVCLALVLAQRPSLSRQPNPNHAHHLTTCGRH